MDRSHSRPVKVMSYVNIRAIAAVGAISDLKYDFYFIYCCLSGTLRTTFSVDILLYFLSIAL